MTTDKILVVEDDNDLRAIYELILQHAGYDVQTSVNGQTALRAVAEYQPALVLLDIFMPVMDGKEFLRQLNIDDYPNMKVVVCSNTSDMDLMNEMVHLGADQVVTKSTLDPGDLTKLVQPYFA